MTLRELEQCIETYGTVSGYLPEGNGGTGQDTGRGQSQELFALHSDPFMEKRKSENVPQKPDRADEKHRGNARGDSSTRSRRILRGGRRDAAQGRDPAGTGNHVQAPGQIQDSAMPVLR